MSPDSTVAEYMHADVVSIQDDATVRQAIDLLIRTNTNSLVVIDRAKNVVGMLSSIDIIHAVVPDYLEDDKHLAPFEAKDVFRQRVKEIGDQPVKTWMTPDVKSIRSDHTLIEAATLLAEHRINQLPVVDHHGKLIGYIGRSNLKKAIGDVFRDFPE